MMKYSVSSLVLGFIVIIQFQLLKNKWLVACFQQLPTPSSPSLTGWGIGIPRSSFVSLKSTTSSSPDDTTSKAEEEESSALRQEKNDGDSDDGDFFKQQLEEVAEIPKEEDQQLSKVLSMPWSQHQEWALKDNLSKYTIIVPLKGSKKEKVGKFVLWRTMLKEVPELTGYPIDFLQERCLDDSDNEDEEVEAPLGILPYLEDYEFTAGGGISGQVYGIPGLADGARIETSEVANIEVTLVKGFIVTSDGSAAYELGRPKREEITNIASLEAAAQKTGAGSYELLQSVSGDIATKGGKLASASLEGVNTEDADGMLLRLGATTGILLAGATAMNMLAHHLTVNVFWV